MNLHLNPVNDTDIAWKSSEAKPALVQSRQFISKDTLMSGAKKDETSCFRVLVNALTLPFRKIWELITNIFCCSSSFLDKVEKDPEAAAKEWSQSYPDLFTAMAKFLEILNKEKSKPFSEEKERAFLKALTRHCTLTLE